MPQPEVVTPARAASQGPEDITPARAAPARPGGDSSRTADVTPPQPPLHPGWQWFLGGTVAAYVGIALLTAAGLEALWWGLLRVQMQVYEIFGLALDLRGSPTRVWALHGVWWGLLAGCMGWGWGALAGMFDPGRLRPLRLAAALLPVVAFAVAGAMISVMPR